MGAERLHHFGFVNVLVDDGQNVLQEALGLATKILVCQFNFRSRLQYPCIE